MSDAVAHAEDPVEPATRQSLPDLFTELVDDGRDWLNAEVAVYRAEARRRLIIAGVGLSLLTLSATLVAGTLVALLIGIMFSLAPYVGTGWATAIVIGATLLIAAIAAQAGLMQLRKLTGRKKAVEGVTRSEGSN